MESQLKELTYQQRLDALRETKLRQTRQKRDIAPMNHDDLPIILPPPELRRTVRTISASGEPIVDTLMATYEPEPNHASGGFFGPKAVGRNFRRLLEAHPTYIDPMSSLAGGIMVQFMSYRDPHWNPDYDYTHLQEEQARYHISPGIGAVQHFCQDLTIGLGLGWGGLLEKVRHYRQVNPQSTAFYDGLEDVILGTQEWIRRHVAAAREMLSEETHPGLRQNLREMAEINERLVTDPPRTFREACQWILWFQMVARMYNNNGALGQLDVMLLPYYERDVQAGILTDDEAIFHIACLLQRETASYVQLGGLDAAGNDTTNPVSYLVLEAIHRVRTPASIAVSVGREVDPSLMRRGVEILFEDKMGTPKFLGIDNTASGFARNGYPLGLGRQRTYAGCHWLGIPGREYTLMDCVKVSFAAVFDAALDDMLADAGVEPSTDELWARFVGHLRRAVEVTAEGIDFHLEHMHQVFPELILDLLSHGPVEKGEDASHGGVDYYNMCIDGADLATAADSFAAIEQRVEHEGRLTWEELKGYLHSDWQGLQGERARLMMRNIPRFGSGGSPADAWAVRISKRFTDLVKEKPTPNGFALIPGLFAWASNINMGKTIPATPNGRHAGAPISHGPNPDPGFNEGRGGTPTQMVKAVASVQPGYGNTAPLQLDMEPKLAADEGGVDTVGALIRSYFDLGGTLLNMNVVNKEQILAAHADPSRFPDLIVRVTGFSAYFSSLSEEYRQLVVDRIVSEE